MRKPHHITCFDSLENLPGPVEDLLLSCEKDSFDLGLDWYKLLTQTTFAPQDILKIYIATDGTGQANLVLPLRSQHNSRILYSLTNFYSSLYAPVVTQDDATDTLTDCFTAIRQENPAYSTLRLQPMPRGASVYVQMQTALRRAGWLPFEYFCFGNWYLPIKGFGYSEYFGQLPARLRNTLTRKGKLFSSPGTLDLRVVMAGDDLDKAIQEYVHIYAVSWKGPEPYPQFIPAFIRLCAAHGWLRLGLAYIHGEVAAAQFWVVYHGRAAIYKLAHDPKFDRYSIGTILTNHLMRHVMEVDKVHEIDYLIGDDHYKQDWMSHRRERWGMLAFNPYTFRGAIGAADQWMRQQIKLLKMW